MRTVIKSFIFYAIVTMFLLVCWKMTFFDRDISENPTEILRVYTNEAEDLDAKSSLGAFVLHPDCPRAWDPYEGYEPLDSVMVSESLSGKDLYIFYIAQIVEQYYPDVDPYVVLSVLEIESHYQPALMSSAGAVGLMQVIPRYHSWRVDKYGLNDLWDPYTNIICGVDLLNDWYQKYGSWETALYGYNHSWVYVNHVLENADILRGGKYFDS